MDHDSEDDATLAFALAGLACLYHYFYVPDMPLAQRKKFYEAISMALVISLTVIYFSTILYMLSQGTTFQREIDRHIIELYTLGRIDELD